MAAQLSQLAGQRALSSELRQRGQLMAAKAAGDLAAKTGEVWRENPGAETRVTRGRCGQTGSTGAGNHASYRRVTTLGIP